VASLGVDHPRIEHWSLPSSTGGYCPCGINSAYLFIYLLLGYQTIIQSILVYGAEVWLIPTKEINKILSTKMDVLRRSARRLMERIKNEHIKETVGVKRKPNIIDIIQNKRLQWYGHIKRMSVERIPKLIMECIPWERRKRGC